MARLGPEIKELVAREAEARKAVLRHRAAMLEATGERREALRAMHSDGRTWEEVAGLVGLSRARVVELVGGPRRKGGRHAER
jgi:hypothetical protein